jgi:hypothetical protein
VIGRLSAPAAALAIAAAATWTASAHDFNKARVTWNGDIARIISARCASCHAEGGRAPMALTTYEQAKPWARAIKDEALARHRPDWRAVRGFGDFSNDPSLSPFEIAMIAAWADGGAPKGTEAIAAPVVRAARTESKPQKGGRPLHVACGEQRLPAGALEAVQAHLEDGQSVGIGVRFPDGRQQVVAWIRDFDAAYATTYWLRKPVALPPGSVVTADASGRCSLTLTITPRR